MSPYKKRRLAGTAVGPYLPTSKWWAASVATVATIVTMLWTGDGINTDEEKTLVIGLLASRILAYAVPKDTEET